MAHELIALYAKREQSKGFAFYPDDEWGDVRRTEGTGDRWENPFSKGFSSIYT